MHRSSSRHSSLSQRDLLESRARGHRLAPTTSEERLWRELVNSKLGVPFRRQLVIGNRFIVDFAAPSVKLVVEVDGSSHHRKRQADRRRDEKLERLGYRVLRLEAKLVVEQPARALERIRRSIAAAGAIAAR
jgi:very-short-patch-repair endonuclease